MQELHLGRGEESMTNPIYHEMPWLDLDASYPSRETAVFIREAGR
jgi:hypothetical protein